MKQIIRKILKEEEDDKRERFIRSAKKLGFILETEVNSNIITDIEINNITYDSKYNEIAGDINITSWCEDPDLFEFTNQLKLVDKEMDKVLLNYTFSSNGSFNKKKGKYNNMMWYFVGCEWMAEGDYILKMKYHFRQEEYDDDEGVN
jgi:hypothetical protein